MNPADPMPGATVASPPARPFAQTAGFHTGLAVGAAGLAVVSWSLICTVPDIQWNSARLAAPFALAANQPLYALRDSGQHLGWGYGPGFPLWYLPVTLATSPTVALVLAGLMNLLTWLAPIAVILRAAGLDWRMAISGAVLGGVLLTGHAVTAYGFSFVHVDAVCLAAGLLSGAALHRAATGGSARWLHLAALALVFGIWTKQIAVMLAPAFVCWLWTAGQHRLIWPLVFWCVVYGAAASWAVFRFFGAEEVLFNLWLVHARNPWRGGWEILLRDFRHLLISSAVWLPLAALAVWLGRRTRPSVHAGNRCSLPGLLLWAGLWQLPLGLTAMLKDGGGLNSVHSVHFAFVAGLIVTLRACGRPLPPLAPGVRASLVGLWLVAIAVPLAGAGWRIARDHGRWTLSHAVDELATLARRQPGRYYFPWNPLVTLMVERKVQPFDNALYYLWVTGLEPPAEKIRAAVPADPIIMYQEPAQGHFALRYFPRKQTGAATTP